MTTKKSLVVGLGIGLLYARELHKMGHSVDTVDYDRSKNPTFIDLDDVPNNVSYECVHICTPNFMHQVMTEHLLNRAKIIFVEKPGFHSASDWEYLQKVPTDTRVIMVKNNQYRSSINHMRVLFEQSHTVKFNWINKNRVPNPGSWFTNRKLSFGGVSRDLLPHLLSYYCAFTKDWSDYDVLHSSSVQRWNMQTVESTDYGIIHTNGVYDVDDQCHVELSNKSGGKQKYLFTCDWKSNTHDDISIEFIGKNFSEKISLGLCPEDAYAKMIQTCLSNYENQKFWHEQAKQDIWIHQIMENL